MWAAAFVQDEEVQGSKTVDNGRSRDPSPVPAAGGWSVCTIDPGLLRSSAEVLQSTPSAHRTRTHAKSAYGVTRPADNARFCPTGNMNSLSLWGQEAVHADTACTIALLHVLLGKSVTTVVCDSGPRPIADIM
jgi:hypothetical protein